MSGENSGSGSGFVAADAQFSTVRILRPYKNFENDYQGKAANIPVNLTPEGEPRDPAAADKRPGFDPNLVAGLPVPQGSRVQLWFPQCIKRVAGVTVVTPYAYFIVWRFRSIQDFISPSDPGRIQPFHFPRQRPGQPDTTVPPPGEQRRFVIPASLRSVGFEQAEPAGLGTAVLNLRPVAVIPLLDEPTVTLPLLPGGVTGSVQQGVFDPAVFGDDAKKADWQPFEVDAEGDEMLIFAVRATLGQDLVWDFAAPASSDFAFSNIYGTGNGAHAAIPEVGIYVQTGTKS
jgi:hypothetical protein